MDAKTFFYKVSKMREAQKQYFKTRNGSALAESKALEREIDAEIARVNAIMETKEKQLNLFEDGRQSDD